MIVLYELRLYKKGIAPMNNRSVILLLVCALLLLVSSVSAQSDEVPVPDFEATVYWSWADIYGLPTVGVFAQQLQSFDLPGCAFSGRFVTERASIPGSDRCWFPGSAIAPLVTPSEGIEWEVDANGGWGPDAIGWFPDSVTYYRNARAQQNLPLPCGTVVYEDMYIDDGFGGWNLFPYTTNELTTDIYASGVCASRQGVGGCRYWNP